MSEPAESFIACPYCSQVYDDSWEPIPPLYQTSWSDLYAVDSQFHEFPFRKCVCGQLLFRGKLKELQTVETNGAAILNFQPAQGSLDYFIEPLALISGKDNSTEMYIRLDAWHFYNHYWRKTPPKKGTTNYRRLKFLVQRTLKSIAGAIPLVERLVRKDFSFNRANTIRLLELLRDDNIYEKIQKAELFRSIGMFRECKSILHKLPSGAFIIEEMLKRARFRNRSIFETTRLMDNWLNYLDQLEPPAPSKREPGSLPNISEMLKSNNGKPRGGNSFTLLLTAGCLFFGSGAMAQSTLHLGMNPESVRGVYSSLNSSLQGNDLTMTREENMYGVDGTWRYVFENDSLKRFSFDRYFVDDQVNAINFKKCLNAARRLSVAYTSAYGKPDEELKGDTLFVNPYVKHHYGYEVMKATWKNVRGMTVDVHFKFFGGKGQYFLILESNYLPSEVMRR